MGSIGMNWPFDTGRRKRINSNGIGIVMYLPTIRALDILAEATEEAQ